MDRRLHLVDRPESTSRRWPSIAAASTELRRPRHLRIVSAGGRTTREPVERLRDPDPLDRRAG